MSSRSSITKRVWDYKFLFGYNCRHKKSPRIDIKGPRLLVKSWTCFLANWALALGAQQTQRKQQQSAFCLVFGRLAFPSEINSVFATALLNLRPKLLAPAAIIIALKLANGPFFCVAWTSAEKQTCALAIFSLLLLIWATKLMDMGADYQQRKQQRESHALQSVQHSYIIFFYVTHYILT